MSKEFIAICAVPPGINPGMSSVDLALKLFLGKHKMHQEVDFYQLYHEPPVIDNGIANILPYSLIPEDPAFFASKKIILFWGDFLHMFQYHQTVANTLYQRKYFQSIEEALCRVYNVFLLADQDDKVLSRKISFGSTLLFNTLTNEKDPQYGPALERFITHGRSWFRDVYSAIKASHIAGNYSTSFLGIDCATLIEPGQFSKTFSPPFKKKKTGLFIGRSTVHIFEIFRFAENFSEIMGAPLEWIQWGDIKAFPTMTSILEIPSVSSLANFTMAGNSDLLDTIGNLLQYDVIITDTYHICVNAWNMGIPAICFAGDDNYKRRNVNSGDFFARRDKRQVFYGMYDALDFLIHYQELMHPESLERRLNHLLDILDAEVVVKGIHQRIRQHAEHSEDLLNRAIESLLNN
ncbi:MAG: hypothetical protein WCI71_08930 [Bacteroidota bacterium]